MASTTVKNVILSPCVMYLVSVHYFIVVDPVVVYIFVSLTMHRFIDNNNNNPGNEIKNNNI